MKAKYHTYSIENLIEDKEFKAWILRGVKHDEWEEFSKEYPEFDEKAQVAKRIILFLRENGNSSQAAIIHELWTDIQQYSEKTKRQKRNDGR